MDSHLLAVSGVKPLAANQEESTMDGFVLSSELDAFGSMSPNERYKPPEVPQGWRSSKDSELQRTSLGYVSTAEASKASTLDAKSRPIIIGEQQLPGKSVFDFLTPSDRARIVAASGKENLPAELPSSGTANRPLATW